MHFEERKEVLSQHMVSAGELNDPEKAGRPLSKVEARGFAMISVLLVIMIFFIITIAISTIIVIQSRNNFETELAGIAFCQADEGIRRATPHVLYRCLMRNLYGNGRQCFQKDSDLIQYTSYTEYIGVVTIDIYQLIELAVVDAEGYKFWNRIACNARILRKDDYSMVAQRDIYADIYMAEVAGAPVGPPGTAGTQGWIKSAFKGYFEKNR
jgi:hypothetical protein